MNYEKRVHAAMREIVAEGLAESAHDVSDGGLAIALAESCLAAGGSIGANIDLDSDLRPEYLLFHEGPSRIVVSTQNPAAVARIATKHGVAAPRIGVTIEVGLVIRNRAASLIDCNLARLSERYHGALEGMLHVR
jgi:phosphoribosylformylglycinamidine synthase